jgi:hypothetical protein
MKLQCCSVKPLWPWLLVIFKREPKRFELSDFIAVSIFEEVDDMSHSEILQHLHVIPSRNGASEG